VENGKDNPSLALGMKLAELLNKRVEDLFFPVE
jgi:DNA-binding XRE family transcriptional regulator